MLLFEKVSDDADLTASKKQKQCCAPKWTASRELSALTARGLATLDYFFLSCRSPLGLELEQLLWDAQSLQQDRRVNCGNLPLDPGWVTFCDQERPSEMHKWLIWREKELWGGIEKAAGCIHPIEVPPGWKLREEIVMIPASSWVSFRLNRLFRDTHDCRWFPNRLNCLSSLS